MMAVKLRKTNQCVRPTGERGKGRQPNGPFPSPDVGNNFSHRHGLDIRTQVERGVLEPLSNVSLGQFARLLFIGATVEISTFGRPKRVIQIVPQNTNVRDIVRMNCALFGRHRLSSPQSWTPFRLLLDES